MRSRTWLLSKEPPVKLGFHTSVCKLRDGDRYTCHAQWDNIQVVSQPRKLKEDAEVYASHDLLGALAAKRYRQPAALRTAALRKWVEACLRGRPC